MTRLNALTDLLLEIESIGTALEAHEQQPSSGASRDELADVRRRQQVVRGYVVEQLRGALATAPTATTVH